jgi:long-chain acyl-CoA synthetase
MGGMEDTQTLRSTVALGNSAISSPTHRNGDLFTRLNGFAAADTGSKTALVHNGTRVSYAELVAQCAGLAQQMTLAGLRPNERVAVVLGNSPEFIIAAFALWGCGAVLVPLDPQTSTSELAACVSNVAARAIITSVRNADTARQLRANDPNIAHVWLYSSVGEWRHEGPRETRTENAQSLHPDAATDPGPAVSLYSTGSTGIAKSVTRTHQMLLGECQSVANVLGITATDRILGVAPFFHRYGLMNSVLLALLSGSTLHIVDSFLPRDVASRMDAERITVFPGFPYMYQLLADLESRKDFSTLRWALCAGAALSEQTVRLFQHKFGIPLRQLYGCTETGAICIQTLLADAAEPISVGPAIPGVSVSIVDGADHELTAGSVGRVRVKSAFAARRYDRSGASPESYFEGRGFFPGVTWGA